MEKEFLDLKIFEDNIVEFMVLRTEMLEKVRKGLLPKGILKRWPIYIIIPN